MFGLGKMLGLGGAAKAVGSVVPGMSRGSDPLMNQLMQRQMAPVAAQPGPLAGLGAGAAQMASMGGQPMMKAPVEEVLPVEAVAPEAKMMPTGGTLGAAGMIGQGIPAQGSHAEAVRNGTGGVLMRPKVGLMDMIRSSMLQQR